MISDSRYEIHDENFILIQFQKLANGQNKCLLWGVVYESNIQPKPVANFFQEIVFEPEKKNGVMVNDYDMFKSRLTCLPKFLYLFHAKMLALLDLNI